MQTSKWTAALGLSLALLAPAYAVDDVFWLDIQNNKTAAVTQYLAQGVDPNIKSREQLPAVMWAIQNGSWNVYDLLVAHRAFDPNIVNGHDETPLMYLALVGDTKRAVALIEKGAQVYRLGWTPLHYAASKQQLDMAQMLLSKGALVNAPAPDGTTPLMMAARSGNTKLVNVLLEQGADPTTRSLNQLSAADWAESNKYTRLADQLRQIATNYQQQRGRAQEKPLTITTQKNAPTIPLTTPKDTTAGSGAKYFDLKRFDEDVGP